MILPHTTLWLVCCRSHLRRDAPNTHLCSYGCCLPLPTPRFWFVAVLVGGYRYLFSWFNSALHVPDTTTVVITPLPTTHTVALPLYTTPYTLFQPLPYTFVQLVTRLPLDYPVLPWFLPLLILPSPLVLPDIPLFPGWFVLERYCCVYIWL